MTRQKKRKVFCWGLKKKKKKVYIPPKPKKKNKTNKKTKVGGGCVWGGVGEKDRDGERGWVIISTTRNDGRL